MTSAGYSGTPLLKKLGIDDQKKICIVNAPKNYFELLEKDVESQLIKNDELPDLVHVFVSSRKEFEKQMKSLKPLWKSQPSIVIWVSWPKKTAGFGTDISENIIRDYAVGNGLVDIKVCAVSEIWSGLKLVVPKAKR